jgi:hypothetical protein
MSAVKILSETIAGRLVTADGLIYFLTPCCHASGTGTSGGVACRSCYQPVRSIYGWGAAIDAPDTVRELALIVAEAWGDTPTKYHDGFAQAMLKGAKRAVRTPVVL